MEEMLIPAIRNCSPRLPTYMCNCIGFLSLVLIEHINKALSCWVINGKRKDFHCSDRCNRLAFLRNTYMSLLEILSDVPQDLFWVFCY